MRGISNDIKLWGEQMKQEIKIGFESIIKNCKTIADIQKLEDNLNEN